MAVLIWSLVPEESPGGDSGSRKSTMKIPAAVLFDLDGTLIDTTELILASCRHTFAASSEGRMSSA